jgi:hypothetical protein
MLAKDMPQFILDIPTPNGIVLAANTVNNSSYELEGDLDALRLINLDREGLGEYKHYLKETNAALANENLKQIQLPQTMYSPRPPPPPVVSAPTILASTTTTSPTLRPVYNDILSSGEQAAAKQGSSPPLTSNDLMIENIFKSMDVNQTGKVSVRDAERTFAKLNAYLNRNYGQEDLKLFFNAVDVNHDETIDFDEFKRAFLFATN